MSELQKMNIDGKPAFVAFMADDGQMVSADDATKAIARFADGSHAYYDLVEPRALGDVEGHPFHGNQWTQGAGGDKASGTGIRKPLSSNPTRRRERVESRARDVAEEMGVPPSIINVVDKEPTEFVVGNQQFKEAGHYDPWTGKIEINARNSYDDRISVTKGIAAHEISHAIYHAAETAQDVEHKEIQNLPPDEYNRLYRLSGYARPEAQQELLSRYPVSAMFYKHVGDSYMETENEQTPGGSRLNSLMDRLQKEDGVSDYSKSYWQPEAMNKMSANRTAINETLAEAARLQVVPLSRQEHDTPKPVWASFSDDLRKLDKVKSYLRATYVPPPSGRYKK